MVATPDALLLDEDNTPVVVEAAAAAAATQADEFIELLVAVASIFRFLAIGDAVGDDDDTAAAAATAAEDDDDDDDGGGGVSTALSINSALDIWRGYLTHTNYTPRVLNGQNMFELACGN